jgi:hypothetical protein
MKLTTLKLKLYGKYQEAKVAGWRNVTNALLTEKYPEPGAATANLSGRRSDITPLKVFLLVFNKDLIKHIADATNVEASKSNDSRVTEDDVLRYVTMIVR